MSQKERYATRNNTNKIIRIHSYIFIAQLIIIESPRAAQRYKGTYSECIDNFIPSIDNDEQKPINNLRLRMKDIDPKCINERSKLEEFIKKFKEDEELREKRRQEAVNNRIKGYFNIFKKIKSFLYKDIL